MTLRAAPPADRAARLRLPDAELVALVLGGDSAAFEGIMRRYNSRLFRIARSITGNDAEAEDCVQEAYLKAYRALDGFRGEAAFSTWLTRVLVHEASRRRRKHTRASPDVERDLSDSHDAAPGPEVETQAGQMRERVEAALDALPEPYRAVFVCRALVELDTDETANVLSLTPETVRVRLFRARGALRESLGPEVAECARAWGFDGERCDRLVAEVLSRIARL